MSRSPAPTMAGRAGRVRLAVLAVGVSALSVWAVGTQATWSDTSHFDVTGPAGAPLLSSSFGVEQRPVDSAGALGPWVGGGSVDGTSALPFGEAADDLRTSAPVYGGVEVRTRADSLAGRLVVGPGEPTGDTGLWSELHLRVASIAEPSPGAATCSAAAFAEGTIVYDGPADTTSSSDGTALGADSAGAALLCFEVSLADDADDDADDGADGAAVGGTSGPQDPADDPLGGRPAEHVEASWPLRALSEP